jgi:transposase
VPNEIYAILKETLGEHSPSYVTVKNWVAQFKRDISSCYTPRPGRSKTVTTSEIINQIDELNLEDCLPDFA